MELLSGLLLMLCAFSDGRLIREYRVTLPMTVEEFKVGLLYTTMESNLAETGGGEGFEIVTNEPFEGEMPPPPIKFDSFPDGVLKGQYTHKILHLRSKVPRVLRALAPTGSLEIHEKAWNAYPFCHTEYSNAYMKENFYITVDTKYVADKGDQDNIFGLSGADLAQRRVEKIDIVNDPISPRDYKEDEDPSKCHSTKADRGPWSSNWQDTTKPIMTAYKLVVINFRWFGLQARIESQLAKASRRLITNFHRKAVCTMDKWYGMTMEEVRDFEDKTKKELEMKIKSGEVSGTTEQKRKKRSIAASDDHHHRQKRGSA